MDEPHLARTILRWPLLVAIGATAILASFAGCAHHMTASFAVEDEEERVLATEDEYIAAEVSRDEATLRKLVDDRFVFNTSRGTTSGKEQLPLSICAMIRVSSFGSSASRPTMHVSSNNSKHGRS